MKKVIIVESCKVCPYLGFYKKTKQYFCLILSTDISKNIEENTININCRLNNAIVDQIINKGNVIETNKIFGNQELCENCNRPKKWCECLEEMNKGIKNV
jgi:hypothetical protein